MITALRHRGPDGFGYLIDGDIGLAHARLSIIDLATGSQPIHNETRTIWVISNGEIFNYVELRAELIARGHSFYTSSDTEVIVHLYEEFGTKFVDHLNGQFALALWDAGSQRLILARDRVGIRPLVFSLVGARLLFASEAKSLFAEGSVQARLDHRTLGQTFTFWGPLEGGTAFEGIQMLPPGTMLIADRRGVRQQRYWDWDFSDAESTPARSRDSYAEELMALLSDAVRLQLRSDVPVGVYLSGGIDSAAITALAASRSAVPIRGFSLSFADPEFDESDYQRDVAERLGVLHTPIAVSVNSIAERFRSCVWHVEAPILRTGPVPLMLLANAVHEAGYKLWS